MHLENGKVVGDTPDEALVIAEADILGLATWSEGRYPRDTPWGNPKQYRQNLINTLEETARTDLGITVRGLTRIAMSQKKLRLVALDVLTQLADEAVKVSARS